MKEQVAGRMIVRVNGVRKELESSVNLAQFLAQYNFRTESCVLELNRKIVERGKYETTFLQDGDSLEVVHFVGGGER